MEILLAAAEKSDGLGWPGAAVMIAAVLAFAYMVTH